MTRNTVRRVEVATPVRDPDLKRRLDRILDVMWNDNVSARDQKPDGNYVRRTPGTEEPLNCQSYFYDESYRLAARRQ